MFVCSQNLARKSKLLLSISLCSEVSWHIVCRLTSHQMSGRSIFSMQPREFGSNTSSFVLLGFRFYSSSQATTTRSNQSLRRELIVNHRYLSKAIDRFAPENPYSCTLLFLLRFFCQSKQKRLREEARLGSVQFSYITSNNCNWLASYMLE